VDSIRASLWSSPWRYEIERWCLQENREIQFILSRKPDQVLKANAWVFSSIIGLYFTISNWWIWTGQWKCAFAWKGCNFLRWKNSTNIKSFVFNLKLLGRYWLSQPTLNQHPNLPFGKDRDTSFPYFPPQNWNRIKVHHWWIFIFVKHRTNKESNHQLCLLFRFWDTASFVDSLHAEKFNWTFWGEFLWRIKVGQFPPHPIHSTVCVLFQHFLRHRK